MTRGPLIEIRVSVAEIEPGAWAVLFAFEDPFSDEPDGESSDAIALGPFKSEAAARDVATSFGAEITAALIRRGYVKRNGFFVEEEGES